MSEEKKSLYCSQCGSEQEPQSRFCTNCGTMLEREVQSENITDWQPAVNLEPAAGVPSQESVRLTKDPQPQTGGPAPSYTEIPTEVVDTGTPYQTGQQQYYQQQNAPAPQAAGNGNIGFSIASMVCGILSIVCCCLSILSGILALAAIILGIVSLYNKYDGRGMAIAGIVLGAVFLVFYILLIAFGVFSGLSEMMSDWMYDFY